jgi:hypothetical protein
MTLLGRKLDLGGGMRGSYTSIGLPEQVVG